MRDGRTLVIVVVSLFLLIFLVGSLSEVSTGQDQHKGCLQCHQEIEPIAEKMGDFPCEVCHRGDPDGSTKEAAHIGLYDNPGDLSIVEKTCGMCHRDEVSRVKKSLHATEAGVISGSRYLWGAQKEKNAIYAVREVEDKNPDIPEEFGAVKALQSLPHYKDSKEPIDDYFLTSPG